MPTLDEQHLRILKTTPPSQCEECKRETWKNYCRQCDEFFWVGHSIFCSRAIPGGEDDHCEHRTY